MTSPAANDELGIAADKFRRWVSHCREFGVARLQIADRLYAGQADAEQPGSRHAYPLRLGPLWRMTVEYAAADYPAEIGFYADIMGLNPTALGPGYGMFASPAEDFHISVTPTPQGGAPTPPDALKLEFNVQDIFATVEELTRRGVTFERQPSRAGGPNSRFVSGYFRTPNGIRISLWSVF